MVLSLAFIISIVVAGTALVVMFPIVSAVQETIECPTTSVISSVGEERVYAVDRFLDPDTIKVRVFLTDGTFINEFDTGFTLASSRIDEVGGIGSDQQGNIYLGSYAPLARIAKFDPDGNLLFAKTGTGDGVPESDDIAVDSQGFIYVVQRGGDAVHKFDSDGNLVLSWGGTGTTDGLFTFIKTIAIDDDDVIFVADNRSVGEGTDFARIQAFDTDGNFLFGWTNFETTGDGFGTEFIAVDSENPTNVYYTNSYDSDDNNITVFPSSSSFTHKISAGGSGEGSPRGVAVDSLGHVFVAIAGNKIRVYELPSENILYEFGGGNFTDIGDIEITGGASVTTTSSSESCESGKSLVWSAVGIVPVALFFGLFSLMSSKEYGA